MEKVDEKLKYLEPILGKQKISMLRKIYYLEDDYRQKKEIENRIDYLISRFIQPDTQDRIVLPPLPQELCGGDIETGMVEYLDKHLYPFKLKLTDINRHLGIFGSTGSGKTTFAFNLIRKLYEKDIPFLVFDWEKSYRDLALIYPDVQVFTVGADINPLFLNFLTVPPGIPFDEYIKSVIAIISEDYVGGIGADTMLLNYMEQAFQETGSPYFEDLKQVVVREIQKDMGRRGKLSGRSGLWKESVSRQITFLSKGASGSIVNPKKHYPLEKLFQKPIVLEFGNLKSPYDRKFFIHVILNWLSIYNQYHGIQSEQLKQVLVFEEFHNIAMKGKEDNMVSGLFRESRKYGIGLIAIDQTPSEIPNSIFANMNVKVSFALGTSQDITAMGRAMNLQSHQLKYLGMLKTGQALINIKQRFHDSFVIRPPFADFTKNISDDELRKAMQKFAAENEADYRQNENQGCSQFPQELETSPSLEPLEKVLLMDIVQKPFDGVDIRTKRLGIHPSQVSQMHESLSSRGLIKTVYIDRKKLFALTEFGKIVAENADIPIPQKKSRGGLEHDYWIHQTVRFLRKHEFQPVCEKDGIDIMDPDKGIAIEVETGKSDIPNNLVKLEKTPVSKRFMLVTRKEIEPKIMELATGYPDIRVMFVKDFIKLPIETFI